MEILYHIFDLACATNETGPQFPQIQKMTNGYDYDASNSIYELSKYYDSLPKFAPNLDAFELNRLAKATDFLSNSLNTSTGYLVSDKVKNLLTRFNLPEHRFYPAKVYHKRNLLSEYYWFQLVNNFRQFVDYAKSEFFIYKNFSQNLGYLQITSEQDYLEKSTTIGIEDPTLSIWASKVRFKDNFPKNIDLFALSRFNASTYISNRLSQSLIENLITGFMIKPNNTVVF